MPSPKKISQFKPLVTNLAQTSHYQVIFGGLSSDLLSYLSARGVNARFIAEDAGLLCSSASLPGSSLATADINGNFMGVMEKMAHTRIYTQLDLEFYVDSNYRTLKFIEHWMEFIASGSGEDTRSDGYYYRMRYPEEYKCSQTKIIKFDKDYRVELEYSFIGMFPINLASTAVSYDSSQTLKMSASFNFERYITGKSSSLDSKLSIDNNKNSDIEYSNIKTAADYLTGETTKLEQIRADQRYINSDSFNPNKLGSSVGTIDSGYFTVGGDGVKGGSTFGSGLSKNTSSSGSSSGISGSSNDIG